MFRNIPEIENKKGFVLSLGRPETKHTIFVIDNIIGSIWTSFESFEPDLSFISDHARKIGLPSYPFDRQRHWIDYKFVPENDVYSAISVKAKEIF